MPVSQSHKLTVAVPAASFMIAIGNSLRVSTPPFPVFVVGFLLIGFVGAFLVSVFPNLFLLANGGYGLVFTATCAGCRIKCVCRQPVRGYLHQNGHPACGIRCWSDMRSPSLDAIRPATPLVIWLPGPHRPRPHERDVPGLRVQVQEPGWYVALPLFSSSPESYS